MDEQICITVALETQASPLLLSHSAAIHIPNLLLSLCIQAPCAVLFQIPNQPIAFAADPLHKQRSEDSITAFCFANAWSDPPDASKMIQMPMTKAAVRDRTHARTPTAHVCLPRQCGCDMWPCVRVQVRAMDAVQEWSGIVLGDRTEEFLVFGASKRGDIRGGSSVCC
jgi:hypothetical protein